MKGLFGPDHKNKSLILNNLHIIRDRNNYKTDGPLLKMIDVPFLWYDLVPDTCLHYV